MVLVAEMPLVAKMTLAVKMASAAKMTSTVNLKEASIVDVRTEISQGLYQDT